jgi:hypothetical protein
LLRASSHPPNNNNTQHQKQIKDYDLLLGLDLHSAHSYHDGGAADGAPYHYYHHHHPHQQPPQLLSDTDLATLPTHIVLRHSIAGGGGGGGALCSICLEAPAPGQAVTTLPYCCHAYHRDCITPWLQEKGRARATCPLCKAPVFFDAAAAAP